MKMVWSIGEWNDTKGDYDHDRRSYLKNGEHLEDGAHRVVFNYIGVQTSGWVIVEDGQFNDQTEQFIGTMVSGANYWGQFIEGFDRDEEGNIEVVIGS